MTREQFREMLVRVGILVYETSLTRPNFKWRTAIAMAIETRHIHNVFRNEPYGWVETHIQ